MRFPVRYSVRSLLHRKSRSALTILGVAVVVFVAVLMTGLSRGLLATAAGSSAPENLIVLSLGAEAMEFSAIEPADFHAFGHASQIRRGDHGPLASPEAYLSTFVQLPGSGAEAEYRGVVRGVLPVAYEVHRAVRIIEGRPPGEGFEVAVGTLAAAKLGVPERELAIGRSIAFEGQRWNIVGVFEAPSTMLESEIWAHLDDVRTAARLNDFSAVTVTASDPEAAEDLLFDLATRTDIRLAAQTEESYYAAAADALRPIAAVSTAVTIILLLGGIMAGMNTMFASIMGRSREMAILVVRGYSRASVMAMFLLESLALSLCGGLIGAAAGTLLNDFPMAVPMGAFRFTIDSLTLGIGMTLAVVIGIAGAFVPLIQAARLRIVDAIKVE